MNAAKELRMLWTSISSHGQADAGRIAALVDHIEDEQFDVVLLELLNEIAPVAEVTGFLMNEHNRNPKPVGWCGTRVGTASRVDRYVRDFHRFDPTLQSLPCPTTRGTSFTGLLAAETLANDVYRNTCFGEPSFSQKISIAYGRKGEDWAILNMYFSVPCAVGPAMDEIVRFGALVAPFLHRRSRTLHANDRESNCDKADVRIARRLGERFPQLTARERTVCALTMIGKSSGEIASALGVSAGTVLTYRRRAYERLGVSNAASLVADLI
jgi:DNA-binding CsgD family transcriptional regulator